MEIKKVSEKYPGTSPALTAFGDGSSAGVLGLLFLEGFAEARNWSRLTYGVAVAGIAAIATFVGISRYKIDKHTEQQYEANAHSNNAAIDVITQLKTENDQLRGSLDTERQRFTDLVASKHTVRAEHAEHGSAQASHHAAHEPAEHQTHHAKAEHGSHAEKHGKPLVTHTEKAAAEKHEAKEAQLSV